MGRFSSVNLTKTANKATGKIFCTLALRRHLCLIPDFITSRNLIKTPQNFV